MIVEVEPEHEPVLGVKSLAYLRRHGRGITDQRVVGGPPDFLLVERPRIPCCLSLSLRVGQAFQPAPHKWRAGKTAPHEKMPTMNCRTERTEKMRRTTHVLALFLLAACATAPVIVPNQYGLRVVPDYATYQRLVRLDPSMRLVDVEHAVPGIGIDVRYATSNNFMHRPLYPIAKVFLRAPAAQALADVERELAPQGLGLKVFDGYRPYRITEAMWEPIKDPDFVADPSKGSRHNRGAAVDLTLVDLHTGDEIAMPTPYDDFTPRARQDFNDLPADVIANRAKLREVMVRHGFDPLPSEWWHFDYHSWQKFELMDVTLEELAAHQIAEGRAQANPSF